MYNIAVIESTHCADPDAKYIVSSRSREHISGIQGYYKTEFIAAKVARFCRQRGDTDVSIDRYSNGEIIR